MNKYIVYGLLAAILVVGLFGIQIPTGERLGAEGDTNVNNLVASGDVTVGDALTVTGATILSGITTLTGEATLGNCATATWNPGSLASSSVDGVSATTTDIAVAGLALGDTCMASLSSATSTAAVFSCNASGTATGTITLANFGSAALDLATGTAKICYFD